MAERKLINFSWGDSDFLAVEFTDTNLRIRRVYTDISAGRIVRAVVWDTDEGGVPGDFDTTWIDMTFTGPTIDEYVIPGIHRVVEVTDEIGSYYDFPPNWVVQFFETMSG